MENSDQNVKFHQNKLWKASSSMRSGKFRLSYKGEANIKP